jgi:hypothetical protein
MLFELQVAFGNPVGLEPTSYCHYNVVMTYRILAYFLFSVKENRLMKYRAALVPVV